MQNLVIGVGEFGVNIACQFFTHLILEHNLIDIPTQKQNILGDQSKYLLIKTDLSSFFQENGDSQQAKLRCNLILMDTMYDLYFHVLKNYPLVLPFLNKFQIVSVHQLPGTSNYQLLQQLRNNNYCKDLIREILRKEFEKKKYQSVIVIHSIGGGTGAGLGSCILAEVIMLRNRLCNTINLVLIPSDMKGSYSTNCLEWYNATSALDTINDSCELTILLDNQALYRVHKRELYGYGSEDLNIKLTDLNNLIVQLLAQLTSTQRFKSKIQKKFSDIIVNTVLYRSIHFVVPTIYNPQSYILNPNPVLKDQCQSKNTLDTNFPLLIQSNFQSSKIQSFDIKIHSENIKKYSKFQIAQNFTYSQTHLTKNINFTHPTSVIVELFEKNNQLATCDELNAENAQQFYNNKEKFASVYCNFNLQESEPAIEQSFANVKEFIVKTTESDFMSMSPCPFSYGLLEQPSFNMRRDNNNFSKFI